MAFSRSTIPLSVRPFLCNLVIVSSFSSKALHLKSHFSSISFLDWLVLLPFLLLPDVFLATISRILLARSSIRWKAIDAGIVGLCLALVTAVAAAVEISFKWQTNSEIDWGQTSRFLQDAQGIQVLFTGIREAAIVFTLHLLLAKITGLLLYRNIGKLLHYALWKPKSGFRFGYQMDSSWQDREEFVIEKKLKSNRALRPSAALPYLEYFRNRRWIQCFVPYIIILIFYISGTDVPYKHLAGSLPFTLTGHSQSNGGEFCSPDYETNQRPFPLKHYIKGKTSWMDWDFADQTDEKGLKSTSRSKWWHDLSSPYDYVHYDPQQDPLRISNQDSAVFEELREVFAKEGVKIKNVMMITLESIRKDVFPLKRSTPIHRNIIQSHGRHEDRELHMQTGNLSTNAQILTGESSGFHQEEDHEKLSRNEIWRNLPKSMGGINVKGAISSSTYTLKNLLTSHCGVGSVPVSFAEEIHHTPYQPCLPQVLDFLNNKKAHRQSKRQQNFRSQQWDTHYMQSVTDQFDNQAGIMQKMGFSNTVARGQLQDPLSKFYPPTEPPSYYFGYADSQLKPYLRDAIEQAKANSRRFFISHLTAATHHPWELPQSFGERMRYVGDRGASDGVDLNKYLNTVKYSDLWLGDIMDMLEETGVANETLTVMFGDHGFAFREDDTVYSTYQGGHISNFRIPLVFFHPHLPRIQVSVNASTMSVLPTILDLLSSSNSVDSDDQAVINELLTEYEGQSLIRPFSTKQGKRQAWHVSLISPGGTSLAISSAAYPYRLILPLCQATELRFTDLSKDEAEKVRVTEWSINKLADSVRKVYGSEAAQWAKEAKEVGTWWFWETRRLWNYREHVRYEAPQMPDDE